MNKHHEQSDEQLSKLYQQRKARNKAPAQLKRQLMAKARQKESGPSKVNILNWISGVAVAGATCLLIGLVVLQNNTLQAPSQNSLQVSIVEVHEVQNDQPTLNDQLRIKYAKNYQQHLQKQEFVLAHHQQQAVLQISAQGWKLSTCNQQTLQVSSELIVLLSRLNRIEQSLAQGALVDIAFDKEGRILHIGTSKNSSMC